MDHPRLIEHAFPLKQASLDSVHEKMCHSGHIKAIHIFPARRPLAACRAALIATLLHDPDDPEKRKELVEKLGGRVVEKVERKKMPSGKIVENIKEETVGGILHWKRETENKETLDWFREEIRKAYGGRAPKVLDPFAGGGAIPLEAMRLGCDTTAIDINPVAWFILKCTLEYPQKLAGQKRPLPDFILKDRDFMEAFFKAQGFKGAMLRTQLEKLGLDDKAGLTREIFPVEDPLLEADLAWHVRAWGKWVLNQARKDLAKYYPTYADFEPIKDIGKKYEKREMKLVPLKDDGTPDIDSLNAEFDKKYLEDKSNPRWVAKPTVAYLWARTVTCKNCRATIPLLKSRWLSKKANKRVILTLQPNEEKSGVVFGVKMDPTLKGGNAAQRREHDKRIGEGTMSRSGATCPCCGLPSMTMGDIRLEGQAGRLGTVITAVVMAGQTGKEFRSPTEEEIKMATEVEKELNHVFADIPFGLLDESTPAGGGSGAGRAFSVQNYGIMRWRDVFTKRQLLALGTFVKYTRQTLEAMRGKEYPSDWIEIVVAYLACVINKMADYNSSLVDWQPQGVKGGHTFMRWALPIKWDFIENNMLDSESGGWLAVTKWVSEPVGNSLTYASQKAQKPEIKRKSAIALDEDNFDIVVTDPPYYDAIPYSDLMDFFHIWLRRILTGLSPQIDEEFSEPLGPKWDVEQNDGELIDDETRHKGDTNKSKFVYEEGMFRVFKKCSKSLKPHGRLVIVFAHKAPNAWETLVSAIIRAGFVVDASWPIQTEMGNRTRSQTSAALSSSVWLVCKKRPLPTRPGWDNKILEEMRENIAKRLRDFWDAGIRGPDFVWAATGPALEAYSKHPVVKKANEPGKLMDVSEFLRHVRRMVVDFVVGRVLSQDGELGEISGLDDVTTYYLLHRHDFGMDDAPSGPCILYAVSCGLTDCALADQFDILARTGGKSVPEAEEEEASVEEVGGGTGATLRLKQWDQRKRQSMGYDPAVDSAKAQAKADQMTFLPLEDDEKTIRRREIPLIDQIHRLMHLWKAGDLVKVDDYLDSRALLRNNTLHQVLQALIELAPQASEERSILESISNQLKSRGVTVDDKQRSFLNRQQDP
jgi:adenine-specific DNA methylase